MVNFGVLLLFCFGVLSNSFGQDNGGDSDINSTTAVYIVTLRQASSLHLFQQEAEEVKRVRDQSKHGDTSKFTRPKLQPRFSFYIGTFQGHVIGDQEDQQLLKLMTLC
jgi:hypothetical protein